jgi:hypothetical protein
VLERAEEHRAFWRPERTRVILLAESHVYTQEAELTRQIRSFPDAPNGIPRGFIRLVYALGYGEDGLLDRAISNPRNSGTPQFWKIFQSCIASPGDDVEYGRVQVSRTPILRDRVRAKVDVLTRLREHGVWLVDASIAALYLPGQPKPASTTRDEVLRASWDTFTSSVVASAEPAAILCIGVGVVRSLRSRLDRLGIPWAGVHQPQAHLSSAEHGRIHELYSLVCDDPRNVSLVPGVV